MSLQLVRCADEGVTCPEVERRLRAALAATGRAVLLVPSFAQALDAQRALGITLSRELLMSPTKSVTAVVGLFEQPRGTAHASCAGCPCRDFCVLLRSGSTCRG